jgi:FkbM family methyltransferase
MVRRPDMPYWVNWLGWHAYHRHRTTKVRRRRAAWDFIKLIRRLPPGLLAIDCGANVGNVTAALVRRGFEVHAFEPDPYPHAVFARRFQGHAGVHLHAQAVGAQPGQAKLYRTRRFAYRPLAESTASSLSKEAHHDEANVETVEVIDLVAFIRQLGRKVDILKLDIEGAEVDILERILDEGLDREIGSIFAETHERFSKDLAERTERLRARVRGIDNINLDWM